MQDANCLSRVVTNKGCTHNHFAVVREEKGKEQRTYSWNLSPVVSGVLLCRWLRSIDGFSGFPLGTGSSNCSFFSPWYCPNSFLLCWTDRWGGNFWHNNVSHIFTKYRKLVVYQCSSGVALYKGWEWGQNSAKSSTGSLGLAGTLCNTRVPVQVILTRRMMQIKMTFADVYRGASREKSKITLGSYLWLYATTLIVHMATSPVRSRLLVPALFRLMGLSHPVSIDCFPAIPSMPADQAGPKGHTVCPSITLGMWKTPWPSCDSLNRLGGPCVSVMTPLGKSVVCEIYLKAFKNEVPVC